MSETPSIRNISITEANKRIAALSKMSIATFSEVEDLDRPLDADIQVSGEFPRTRISLLVEGQQVSWAVVYDLQQQIGPHALRMGGIGDVGTHDEHRFRGYSRRVLENVLRWMRREGFDLTMLFGITGFYPRFGYAKAFPAISHTLAVRDAERAGRRHTRVEDFTPTHLEGVLALYAANNAARTGVVRRDPRQWEPFRKGLSYGTPAKVRVLLDARGAVIGYVVADTGTESEIIEVGYASTAVFDELLREIAAQVWAVRREEIHLHLPADHAFVRYCQPLSLRTQLAYRRDGGAMVRLINVPSTLRKVAPSLAKRLSGHGQLTIQTNLDSVGLSWANGAMTVGEPHATGPRISLPQWCLAQLLYGYLGASSPALEGIIQGSRASLAILADLFPETPHFFYATDQF